MWTILMLTMWCLTGSQASDTRRDYIILCQQRHSGPQSGQCDGQVGLLFFLAVLCCHFCHLNGECWQQSLKSMHTYADVLPVWCHTRSASIFWRRGVVKMLNKCCAAVRFSSVLVVVFPSSQLQQLWRLTFWYHSFSTMTVWYPNFHATWCFWMFLCLGS